jgi:hypothetical protein
MRSTRDRLFRHRDFTWLHPNLAKWLDAHPDARLVAVDRLGRVRPRDRGRSSVYELDVAELGRLQRLFVRRPGVALLIVHHSRKEASDDFLATVSGTFGLTGSTDTIVVIRRKRSAELTALFRMLQRSVVGKKR